MKDSSASGPRLDSWKAIAEYLQRDVATARRWEKQLGLPVRRLPGGAGRSVFAFTSEIDAWLATADTRGDAPAARHPWPEVLKSARWRWTAALAVAAIVVATGAWRVRAARIDPAGLHVEIDDGTVKAFDAAGEERWRYAFPSDYKWEPIAFPTDAEHVVIAPDPGVYVGFGAHGRRADDVPEGGLLAAFDIGGHLRRTFTFDDHVTFHGTTFRAPWVMTAYAVDDASPGHRVAVAAHHFTWNPGLVTVLDEQWHRRGTFVHDGWIEDVRWIAPNRLLVAGFSNAHDGGMVALLDADRLNGQGPEPAGSIAYCETCGTDAPIRMVILPRTEINRVTASPFNHVRIQLVGGHILAHTIEVPAAGGEAIDAIYEFTPSLDLVSARYSDRYWEVHRALEAQGRIDHSREDDPERDGPREIQEWDAAHGWSIVQANSGTK